MTESVVTIMDVELDRRSFVAKIPCCIFLAASHNKRDLSNIVVRTSPPPKQGQLICFWTSPHRFFTPSTGCLPQQNQPDGQRLVSLFLCQSPGKESTMVFLRGIHPPTYLCGTSLDNEPGLSSPHEMDARRSEGMQSVSN